MSTFTRYTVTSALPYANGPLHIGHIAGAYLPADIYVRYLRMNKMDVAFICGSDEHGAAITIQAIKEGINPRDIIDKYHAVNKKAFEDFGISFDIFHRTSEKLHHETASQFFLDLYKKGVFEERESEQYYDEEFKQFLADRYIEGTCPKCGNPKAYGDQCEKCGSSLSPTELINPVSKLSGNNPVLKKTKHWYLPMQNYESWLREWVIDGHKNDWKTNVYGQCKSWLDGGLQSRAMTRDLDWGVKVPLKEADGKVLYVWLDAPIGYISATKQWASDHGKDWKLYWQSPDTRLIHFIGKDNIVFHCIIFPIILKAHGEYILPDNVPANEFLNLEGDKLSTSRNWAVWLHEYLIDFPNKQDELRYVLCSISPETKDSEFTWKDYQARVNNELVAILGNYVNRVFVLTQKYCNGVMPENFPAGAEILSLQTEINSCKKNLENNLENFKFRDALSELMNIARIGNKYLTDTEPWKLVKTDEAKTKAILGFNLEIIRFLAVVMCPFLPNTSDRIFHLLNLDQKIIFWKDAEISERKLSAGHVLKPPELLFEKIEDEVIEFQISKLSKPVSASAMPAIKSEITFDDFSGMDIRTATILKAEKVQNADKLLKLEIDLGLEQRTIVSGIAEHYKPEEIIGKQVCIIANLAPRKIKGIESRGMILMAEGADKKLHFVSPATLTDNGSTVK